jgi:hypothetical protein
MLREDRAEANSIGAQGTFYLESSKVKAGPRMTLLEGGKAPETVMKRAASLKNLRVKMLRPGTLINTSPTDYYPIEQSQMLHLNGNNWETIGDVIAGEVGGT